MAHLIPCLFLILAQSPAPDYEGQVAPIFRKHCTGCHNSEDKEGGLVLESHPALLKGGKRGAVVEPGKSGESRLLLSVEKKAKPFMPPGKREELSAAEIATLRAWIEAGASGPSPGGPAAAAPVIPRIEPRVPPRMAIHSAAWDPLDRWIALARHGRVDLLFAAGGDPGESLGGMPGTVTVVAFSADGALLVAGGGEQGRFGEARIYRFGANGLPEPTPWRTLPSPSVPKGTFRGNTGGHTDCLYAAVLSPDGRILATGSYDQRIILWDLESGQPLRTLTGHNAAVFDLAFRRDGKVLASASGDRTVKLWEVATGARLDTFSQPLKEVYTVAFSPDGARVAAAGADNRIRLWRVSEGAQEGTNTLLESRFAHEGAILKLLYSPDGRKLLSSAEDRTVKVWSASEVRELRVLEKQPDWPAALAFAPGSRSLVTGRLDGSFQFYSVESGQVLRLARGDPIFRGGAGPGGAGRGGLPRLPAAGLLGAALLGAPADPPAKPELSRPELRGIRRGETARIRLLGKNLQGASGVKSSHAELKVRLDGEAKPGEVSIEVAAGASLPRGGHEIWLATPAGETGKVRLEVDDLPQVLEAEPNGDPARATPGKAPASFWGAISAGGDADLFSFEVGAGESLVLDLRAVSLGSKLTPVLTILDERGAVLADRSGTGDEAEPLLEFWAPAAGRYFARVSDLTLGASDDHFYRLTIAALPFVTAVYPPSLGAGAASEVELIGYHLPAGSRVKVEPAREGEQEVSLDPGQYRFRRPLKVKVSGRPEALEAEPNDAPGQATALRAPAVSSPPGAAPSPSVPEGGAVPLGPPGEAFEGVVACGRIWRAGGEDADLFRFEARAGESWIIETEAASLGSPVDTRLEVLWPDGRPVERMLLQAVRDSYITFRGIDSTTIDVRVKNWEEMELNQLLYMQGEVAKLFRMPQGPDSGFNFYLLNGKRRAWFDTSATSHALDEPCYIVEPHPAGTKLGPNGLPLFTLYYANDDDGERRLGRDSRLTFEPPADGQYLVRVSDSRGQGGERFAYRLKIRPARPDFQVSVRGQNPGVNAGSGRGFAVAVDRLDGFEGEVKVEITGLPPGFTVTSPLSIEAGHAEAKGTLLAAPDAPKPTAGNESASKIVATALVGGKQVTKEAGSLGKIRLEEKPKLFIRLEPVEGAGRKASGPGGLDEIEIAPGQSVPALLKVERNGHQDLVTFNVVNLPHGVIVDDIGLNGVLIPAGQNERRIFLTAAKWVPETTRVCHAVEDQAGNQTSPPVLLQVRRSLAAP